MALRSTVGLLVGCRMLAQKRLVRKSARLSTLYPKIRWIISDSRYKYNRIICTWIASQANRIKDLDSFAGIIFLPKIRRRFSSSVALFGSPFVGSVWSLVQSPSMPPKSVVS
jgi:hypothetical protein